MASSTKDKDAKKAGHRRSSSTKSGDKNGAGSASTPNRKSGTTNGTTASPHLPRQNSTTAATMSATPKAAKPTGAAPPAASAMAPMRTAPAKSPSSAAKPAAPPTAASPATNARRVSAPAVPNGAPGAAAAGGAPANPQQNAMGGYGSMGLGGMSTTGTNGGYGSMGLGGYGSMGPGALNGGYGSMGPGGAGAFGSMGGGPEGGMNGAYGSMGGAGAENGMMGGGGGGYGSMYGGGGAPGSMYGMGGGGGSMYYGGMGGPMGSMYGMNPMMGSMYGMNPMMGGGGSMYGMGGMGGSMYGMGGMGGSMYSGMGSMYGLGRYNSMGLGSTYGSMYGIGRTTSRSSFHSTGGYVGGSFGGLWRAPAGAGHGGKKDYSIPPPSSKLSEDFPDSDKKEEEKTATKTTEKREAPSSTAAKPAEKSSAATATTTVAPADASAADKKGEAKKAAPAKDGEKKGVTPSVVVVDNAAAKDDKTKSRAVPLALASSHRLTKQVNDNVHVVAVAPNESMINKTDKTVKIGSTNYTMDEVAVSPVDIAKSDLLTDVVEQTHCGHNVSLLALCGTQKYDATISTITEVVKSMMDSFVAEEAQVTQVLASAVVFCAPDTIVDLLADGDAAAPVKAELGSNPIYGPCVMNTSEKKIASSAEAVAVVETAATKAEQRGLVVITYKLKQIRPAGSNGTQRDVYVSSMLVALVDDANMQHVRAAEKHGTACPTPLFGNAIGGASRTVVVLQIPEADAEKAVGDAAASAHQLRQIKNTPTRSGNVRRFVDYTERAAAANAKTSPETTAKINRMLADAKELLEKPEETALVAYHLYAPGQGASPSNTAAITTAVAVAPADEVKKTEASPRSVEKKGATPAAPAAAAAADDDDKTQPEAERKLRLVVCVDGTKPMPPGDYDEAVLRASPTEVPETAMLKSLRASFRHGRNAALVSAETQASIALKDQYTWRCVESVLGKCLGEPVATATATTVELFMVVVQKRQVLCDLLAESSTSKPMVIASSPLFGPIIADSKHKTLKEAAEVRPALEQALAAAPPHLKEADAMIVMTAVLKQVQQSGDVVVASFSCVSGPSAAGVRGAMSKNPDYSRSLFAYMIGGPCVSALLVGLGDDHDANAAAKSSLEDFEPLTKQPNHASRDGSVNAFLEYAKKSLGANEAKMAKAATDAEKEHLRSATARLQMMHDDYKALAAAPQDNTPGFYIGDRRVSEAPKVGGKAAEDASAGAGSSKEAHQRTPVPIRSVVVVVEGGEAAAVGAPALEVAEKEVALGAERYAVSEAVTSKNGMLRSTLIDEVHQVALSGYNAAMLTNDVTGSTVGISMVVKTITVILRGLPANSEAFWTSVVSKDNKVKDMLADNSPYYDLHLASSPLFGNVAYGANIVPVTEAQVEPMVREVRNEVRENGGVGYIDVILRITKPDGDVCMSSFLATIAGESVEEYDKMLESRSSSRLLSTAIGGPCHTLYVVGVRGPAGDGAKPMLEVAGKMMKVHNLPLRSGSLRRFVSHTEPTLASMQRKLELNGAPNPALMAQIGRIGTMLKDAQSMLSSPGGSAPAVYKR